jgi:hypothetical protein
MRRAWLILLTGIVLLIVGKITAAMVPDLTEPELIDALRPGYHSWSARFAMAAGTFSQLAFFVGILLTILGSIFVGITETTWFLRIVAWVVFLAAATYLSFLSL